MVANEHVARGALEDSPDELRREHAIIEREQVLGPRQPTDLAIEGHSGRVADLRRDGGPVARLHGAPETRCAAVHDLVVAHADGAVAVLEAACGRALGAEVDRQALGGADLAPAADDHLAGEFAVAVATLRVTGHELALEARRDAASRIELIEHDGLAAVDATTQADVAQLAPVGVDALERVTGEDERHADRILLGDRAVEVPEIAGLVALARCRGGGRDARAEDDRGEQREHSQGTEDPASVAHPKGCRRMMVWSRSGPVEMTSIGTPTSSSMRARYARASGGRSASRVTPSVTPFQPGISS